MRVVIIDKEESFKVGGIVVFNKRLKNHLTIKGHQVSIIRFANKKLDGKDFYRIPYYLAEARSFIFLPSEKSLNIIRKYLFRIKPDIVYTAAGLSPLDFLLPSLCHDMKIPIAGVWHADINNSLGSLQVLTKSVFLAYIPFCKQLDALHVFTQKLAQFYIDHGILRNRINILTNGVNPDLYKPGQSAFAKKYKIRKGILFLGRLTLQKNPEILIKTFLRLDPSSDTKLVIVGHGDLAKDLQEKYQDSRIIFTGVIENEREKLDIMRSCQIYVLPSRFEGMSLALLEAMSTGLACIASDAGANRELLEDAGIAIPETKLNHELPLAIRVLLEHPDITELLGRKARQKVLREYSQQVIFSRLTQIFQNTITDYKKRGSPKSQPLDLDKIITDKLKDIWKKTKELGANL